MDDAGVNDTLPPAINRLSLSKDRFSLSAKRPALSTKVDTFTPSENADRLLMSLTVDSLTPPSKTGSSKSLVAD